jgi:hypothetical protein
MEWLGEEPLAGRPTLEKVRIGFGVHDLLGHSLSVIALKSELAARLLERDPARATSEIEEIQVVTREALAEVREAVEGYRGLALAESLTRARSALTAAGIGCALSETRVGLPADVDARARQLGGLGGGRRSAAEQQDDELLVARDTSPSAATRPNATPTLR